MMHSSKGNLREKLERLKEKELGPIKQAASSSTTENENQQRQQQNEEEKQMVVTPTTTTYLCRNGEYSPVENKLTLVQSTHSLLGLVGLEGHEDDIDDDFSNTGVSAVTEDQEVAAAGLSLSLSTRNSHEDGTTCNTTPPGSVQGPGILSLSPPRLTTYSVGSATSASVTGNLPIQHHPVQPFQHMYRLHQESPRFSRSSVVQHPQLQPQPSSRPPRPHHHASSMPGVNNNGGGAVLISRPAVGTGPEPLSGAGASGGGHTRTPTDATNYSFLSSLTDASGGEYSTPRRRTLSWDNNGNTGRVGPSLESKSLGGPSTPGSIFQPILFSEEEMQAASRPPLSISATNLRRASPTTTDPPVTTPLLSSQNTKNGSLLAPSPMPSRENLHPLIQERHNASHGRNASSVTSSPLPSSSQDDNSSPHLFIDKVKKSPAPLLALSHDGDNALHPLIQKLHKLSSSKSGGIALTTTTKPFTVHLQDEEKHDDSTPSLRMPQQLPLLERRTTDYSSARCSATTISLQKITATSPNSNLGSTIGSDKKNSGYTRFDLKTLLDITKESSVETEILKGIEGIGIVESTSKISSNDESLLHMWPYFLLAIGVLTLGSRGFFPEHYVGGIFCLALGVAITVKRELCREFLGGRVTEYYRDELLILRKNLVLLNEIATLSTKEEKYADSDTESIDQFRCGVENFVDVIDRGSSSSLESFYTARENFVEASGVIFERFAKHKFHYEISFDSLCQVAKLSDDSTDKSKVTILSELFCPSRKGQVSKLDFIKSTDSIYKTALLLIAKMDNFSQIHHAIEGITNVVFYTIALISVPCVFGADVNTLVLTLLGTLVNFTLVVCFTSAEYFKGIMRVVTRTSYDIGDRVHFIKSGEIETMKVHSDGPPSGGWIVEKRDLYNTSVRQGITGECRTFANGSPLLEKSRVVSWKRSHMANVSFSLKLAGTTKTGRDQIDFFQRQISDWIEDRPHEWLFWQRKRFGWS